MVDYLTKRIVAQRQLITAIRLLLGSADVVSIYTLAANAWEIIDTLATRAGIDSVSNQTRENIPAGSDLKHDYINSPYRNFFKHADRDPDASIPLLTYENTEAITFLAVEDYIRLFKMSPVEFQIYQLWYLSKNEEKLSAEAIANFLKQIREIFPNIKNYSREKQLAIATDRLAFALQSDDIIKDPRTERYL